MQGKVTDAETGESFKGIVVWVEGTTISSNTDEKGRYSLKVPLSYYEVHAERNGFYGQVKEYGEILGVNVEADYFFEEMKPKTEREAEHWEHNRQKYFDGSLRHFLIAMAGDKSPFYFGYRLYSG
ncbi:MAG: carboxypeptidase regulatory-like domain-containing protein [Balneolaceae bacterium]